MIRGGVSSVFDKRFFKANNRYLDAHNNGENNMTHMVFYWTQTTCMALSWKNYHCHLIIQNININKILGTSNDSGEGYFLEVDLHYPMGFMRDMKIFHLLQPKRESTTNVCEKVNKSCWKRWMKLDLLVSVKS